MEFQSIGKLRSDVFDSQPARSRSSSATDGYCPVLHQFLAGAATTPPPACAAGPSTLSAPKRFSYSLTTPSSRRLRRFAAYGLMTRRSLSRLVTSCRAPLHAWFMANRVTTFSRALADANSRRRTSPILSELSQALRARSPISWSSGPCQFQCAIHAARWPDCRNPRSGSPCRRRPRCPASCHRTRQSLSTRLLPV